MVAQGTGAKGGGNKKGREKLIVCWKNDGKEEKGREQNSEDGYSMEREGRTVRRCVQKGGAMHGAVWIRIRTVLPRRGIRGEASKHLPPLLLGSAHADGHHATQCNAM